MNIFIQSVHVQVSDQAKTCPAQPPATAMQVWYTPDGGRPHVLTLMEHSYCVLEWGLDF